MSYDQLIGEIRGLLAQDRKIEAIKRLREATGWDLKQAKDAVEALAAGDELPAMPPADTDLEDLVLLLLREGEKIDAIKVYRERTGMGLSDSKLAVEAIAARHGIAPARGCAALVLYAVLTVGLALDGLLH